jgi:hypothetical protein
MYMSYLNCCVTAGSIVGGIGGALMVLLGGDEAGVDM